MVQKAPQVVAAPLSSPEVPSGPLPLSGKVFAITGGASGIGRATAQVLSRRGATVCVADVDHEAMKAAEDYFSSFGVPHMVTKVDVSKRKEVDAWIESIIKEYGRLDGAANVAGVIGKFHGVSPVSELDDDEWDRIIGVNLTGTMYCMRAELRNIVDRGSIVNVSSIHGLKGIFAVLFFPHRYVPECCLICSGQALQGTAHTTQASTASSASPEPPPLKTASARSASTAWPPAPSTPR